MTATDDRTADELAHPAAQRLLTSATLLRLAYTGTDGTPRVVPVGFLWNGSAVVVSTAVTAPKVAALRRAPDVAITIDESDTPIGAHLLLLRGRAEIDVVDGVTPEYLESAAKSMSGEQLAGFEDAVRATYPRMARISITPSWARYFDFGAGRLPEFLRELGPGS